MITIRKRIEQELESIRKARRLLRELSRLQGTYFSLQTLSRLRSEFQIDITESSFFRNAKFATMEVDGHPLEVEWSKPISLHFIEERNPEFFGWLEQETAMKNYLRTAAPERVQGTLEEIEGLKNRVLSCQENLRYDRESYHFLEPILSGSLLN